MTTIKINNVEYYETDFIKIKIPNFGAKCITLSKIVERYNIDSHQYLYVSKNKNGYKILPQDSNYRCKKLLISKAWADEHLFAQPKLQDENMLPNLPPIMELSDEEAFKDKQGNVINITVRGERHPDKIFFRAKDVGSMLHIDHIKSTLHTKSFEENIHYVYFNNKLPNGERDTTSKFDKVTYLTYKGLLRLLFVCRHPIADHFVDWVTKVIFAAHLGTPEQKEDVCAQVLHLNLEVVRCLLNTNAHALPIIYFLELGQACQIRHKLGIPHHIPDDHYIFKYGLTKDAQRRFYEHDRTFKKLDIVPILKYHTYIDPVNLSQAEKRIKDYFEGYEWTFKHDMTELAALPPKFVKGVNDLFVHVGKDYAGKVSDLQQENMDLRRSVEERNKDLTNMSQTHAHVSNMEREKYQTEIRLKDEIMNLKDELLQSYKDQLCVRHQR